MNIDREDRRIILQPEDDDEQDSLNEVMADANEHAPQGVLSWVTEDLPNYPDLDPDGYGALVVSWGENIGREEA
jgi:hypothetical protein